MSWMKKVFAIALVATTTIAAVASETEAANGRKAKLAAGIAIGAIAAGTVAAIASNANASSNRDVIYTDPYNNQFYQPQGGGDPVYLHQPQRHYQRPPVVVIDNRPRVEQYYEVDDRFDNRGHGRGYGYGYGRPDSSRAVNGCHRAGRKLYGYRHGRLTNVHDIDYVGRDMFRIVATGVGFEGPYPSRIVCHADSRGNVRDFDVR
jgi:hypothetical protein